jgi:hypothetical protein
MPNNDARPIEFPCSPRGAAVPPLNNNQKPWLEEASAGAGRPVGSKNKFSIHDFFSKGDVETFIEFLKANYMEDAKL